MRINSSKTEMRYMELDILRGIAIVMMVIYHLLFDLEYLGRLPAISLYTGFWKGFQICTAGLFLFLVGVSLTISYNSKFNKFLKNKATSKSLSLFSLEIYKFTYLYFPIIKRGVFVFLLGLLISVVAKLVNFGNIDFGILHFIGLSIILSLLFINLKWLNIFLALLIFIFTPYFAVTQSDNIIMFFLGSPPVGYSALDYFSIFPWYGFVLAGISIGNLWYTRPDAEKLSNILDKIVPSFIKNNLLFLGKNSLIIYLLHQPLLFLVLNYL